MGTPERRLREKEARRDQILDCAERVFFERGFDHATIDDVAARAEVSKGLVYLYFANKQELFFALTLRGLELLHSQMRKQIAAEDLGCLKFRRIGETYVAFSRQNPGYFGAISSFGSSEAGDPQVGSYEQACAEELDRVLETMVATIEQGIADGSMRADLPPLATAISVWSQVHGLIQMVALRGSHLERRLDLRSEQLYEAMFSVVGHGIVNPLLEGLEPEQTRLLTPPITAAKVRRLRARTATTGARTTRRPSAGRGAQTRRRSHE